MKRKGFTLIELLVVIAIIGVLIAFLAPKFMGAKDKANEAAVKSIMHSVQLAVESYNMENDVYPLGTNISLADLYTNYLSAGGYLAEMPKNPFTGSAYGAADTAGKITYSFDDASGKYTLTGYRRSGFSKVLELSNM